MKRNESDPYVLDKQIEGAYIKFFQTKWSEVRGIFTADTQYLTPAVVKYKNLEAKWSLGGFNHNKISRELQTRFDWVCTWGIMYTCNILQPPSTGLSGTQFSNLNSAGINDPEGLEK
jgi:hypothetical protein